MHIAHTLEIDDSESALSDILDGLQLEKNLLKHSVGIISCYPEFLDSNILELLKDSLPFEIVGITTISTGTNKFSEPLALTLTVLTSDDSYFYSVVSNSLLGNFEEELDLVVKKASLFKEELPKLGLIYLPMLNTLSGNDVVDYLDHSFNSKVPFFGTNACDQTSDYHFAKTIFNENTYSDRAVFIFCYGNLKPEFNMVSIGLEDIQKQKAIVTKAVKNRLYEINGIKAMDHFKAFGLTEDQVKSGLGAFPLVIEYDNDSTYVCRAVFGLYDDGSIYCGGTIPNNSRLSFGKIDYTIVIKTVGELLKTIEKNNNKEFYFISCMARYFTLGLQAVDEMKSIDKLLPENKFFITYSGGEVCPIKDKDGKLVNRYHNNTICCLSFKDLD